MSSSALADEPSIAISLAHDASQLYTLCQKGNGSDVKRWEPVLDCISSYNIQAKDGKVEPPNRKARCTVDQALQYRDPASNNQTPLHLVCERGAPVEVVSGLLGLVSTKSDMETILSAQDSKGHTPLHLALSNICPSPEMIQLLLQNYPEAAFVKDTHGHLPVSCLGSNTTGSHGLEQLSKSGSNPQKAANKCFDVYMEQMSKFEHNNTNDMDLFQAVDKYPDWLRNHALLNQHVQDSLNRAVAQRFSTSIIFFDTFFLLSIIVTLQLVATRIIEQEENLETMATTYNWASVILLFATTYFAIRKLVHMFILMLLQGKLPEPGEYLNTLDHIAWTVLMVVLSVLLMSMDPTSNGGGLLTFLMTLASATAWIRLLRLMSHISIEQGLLLGGVLSMLPKIFAFMMVLAVFLLAFAQMLLISTTHSSDDSMVSVCFPNEQQQDREVSAFCTYSQALLRVYTMSVGEVDENDFEHSVLAKILYALFLMAVAIMLANVLAYLIGNEIIQHEHHELRFWWNRMDFVLSLDEIILCKHILNHQESDNMLRQQCRRLWSLFANKQLSALSGQFWGYAILRLLAVFVIGPLWFLIGFATAGWLWPPQFREYLFYARTGKSENTTATVTTSIVNNATQQQPSQEILSLRNEVVSLKGEVKTLEAKLDRLIEICSKGANK
ncbi:Ankyrin Repeat [Seminavis robusta]|uniref:Ankyrin Repeat n=1 Tax=Seminavis robusta TaxID=568900 RepID=A0A9N8EJL1_9STRA|nr:Ankyrin Repeat [Seminavis robusta]|eukprot:Sro1184_g250180.1 Ankyrin Repeat (669) ;mRNA; f:30735-32741